MAASYVLCTDYRLDGGSDQVPDGKWGLIWIPGVQEGSHESLALIVRQMARRV